MPKMSKGGKGGGKPIKKVEVKKNLSGEARVELLEALEARFEKNMNRHKGLKWGKVLERLEVRPKKLVSLAAMEDSGGEPDVVGFDKKSGEFIFYDCSAESPGGRRSICYDSAGEKERIKQGINPGGNAVDLASEMGIEVLTQEEYRGLQELGEFDLKTSSWVVTPVKIRKLGGALFCDRRYDSVFTYHNGAGSFYGARGFRGKLGV